MVIIWHVNNLKISCVEKGHNKNLNKKVGNETPMKI